MIQSMTGYGKATAELSDKKINIEIKSLNSKSDGFICPYRSALQGKGNGNP